MTNHYDEAREQKKHDDPEYQWAYWIIFGESHGLRQCGCGHFEARLELIRETLRAMPLYDLTNEERAPYQTTIGEMFLCLLDGAGLIEHGTSIGGSWLTDKGERILKVLNDEHYWALLLGD